MKLRRAWLAVESTILSIFGNGWLSFGHAGFVQVKFTHIRMPLSIF